jgi:TolA-binding protein
MNARQILILASGVMLLSGGVLILASQTWNLLGTNNPQAQEEREAYATLREADELLRQNSDEAARTAATLFNRTLSRNINLRINQLATYGLAAALEKTGDGAAALQYYRALKRDSVRDPLLADKVDYSLGKLLLFINHEEEGRSLLESLLAKNIDPQLRSRVHAAFGYFFLRKNEHRRAEDNFRVALKYEPENLQAERGRALAARRQGRDWAAYAYYDEYLLGNANLEPAEQRATANENLEHAYNQGVAAYRQGRYGESINYLRRVLNSGASATDSERALFWLAESYAANGSTDSALRTYNRVTQNQDASFDQAALIKRGILLSKLGRTEEAARSFQRAVDGFPAGAYTEKAIEWKREMDAQIRERLVSEDLERRPGAELHPENLEGPPARSSENRSQSADESTTP